MIKDCKVNDWTSFGERKSENTDNSLRDWMQDSKKENIISNPYKTSCESDNRSYYKFRRNLIEALISSITSLKADIERTGDEKLIATIDKNLKYIRRELSLLEKLNIDDQDKSESRKSNNRKILNVIISIMDEIDRLNFVVEKSGNEKIANLVNLTIKSMDMKVSRIGLERKSCIGELFDENYHSCIDMVSDLEKEDDIIIEEIKQCYIYKKEVIRPAEVVIVNND